MVSTNLPRLAASSVETVTGLGHSGWQRVRLAIGPVLQAAVAAVLAYQIGVHVFGHSRPFFAAVAAWLCLGWSFERNIRRVAEIAIGVTLGVAIGDVVVRTIGSGWWQLGLVLVVSVLLARFLDSGPLLVTQAGSQAIVIAGLPEITGGPYGRALDAAIGGLIALAFTVLTPYRPAKSARQKSAAGIMALSTTAALLASGLRTNNPVTFDGALAAARSSEPLLTAAISQATTARKQTHWTIDRKHEAAWIELEQLNLMLERAMRSLRVLARRLRFDAVNAPLEQRVWLAGILNRYSSVCLTLAEGVRGGLPLDQERADLVTVAHEISTPPFYVTDPAITTGAAVFRAVIVDTLQAAGVSPEQATAALA